MKLRTPENAERVCALIAEGYTLRQVAREVGIQSAGSITDWVAADADFAVQYARAKQAQAELMAAELLEIADDGTNDWVEREGGPELNGEHIQRSRLRVDTRKWLLSKMLPKVYGDKLAVGGDPENPVVVTLEARQAATKAILDAAFGKEGE